MRKRQPGSSLVYTTDPPAAPEPEPQQSKRAAPSAGRQTAKVSLDRKGRGGKVVTLVSGLRHDPATLEGILKRLKQQCGAGGALKEGSIEIQGDQRERVVAALQAMGYGVKRAGG